MRPRERKYELYEYNVDNQREPKWWCVSACTEQRNPENQPQVMRLRGSAKKSVERRKVSGTMISTTDEQRGTPMDQWIKEWK